jgi:hypothetical protein
MRVECGQASTERLGVHAHQRSVAEVALELPEPRGVAMILATRRAVRQGEDVVIQLVDDRLAQRERFHQRRAEERLCIAREDHDVRAGQPASTDPRFQRHIEGDGPLPVESEQGLYHSEPR